MTGCCLEDHLIDSHGVQARILAYLDMDDRVAAGYHQKLHGEG